ncbi:MAG TPA: hypothetical protein VK943_15240 [Arenibaculum sp.]|nr:hypothetical protein [Arenibaculum sp.]
MEDNSIPSKLRGLPRLAMIAALAVPLLAACGEEEVAEEPVEAPVIEEGVIEEEGVVENEGVIEEDQGVVDESDAAIEDTLDETEDAIEAVPEEPAPAQ